MKDKIKEFKERYYDKLFPGGGDDYDFMWGDFIKILTQAREDERKKIKRTCVFYVDGDATLKSIKEIKEDERKKIGKISKEELFIRGLTKEAIIWVTTDEYKKGYNQRLKDEGKTGERWQHLYL